MCNPVKVRNYHSILNQLCIVNQLFNKVAIKTALPGAPVAKTACPQCRGPRFDPLTRKLDPHRPQLSSHAAAKEILRALTRPSAAK